MKELIGKFISTFPVGPFVSNSDGLTPVTDLTLSGADEKAIRKYGNATPVSISGNTFAAIESMDGHYDLTLTNSQMDTYGPMRITIQDDSKCLPFFADVAVVTSSFWHSKYNTVNLALAGAVSSLDTRVASLDIRVSSIGVEVDSIQAQVTSNYFRMGDFPVSGYLPSSEALNAHMITLPTSLTLNAHMITLPNSEVLNTHIGTLPVSGYVPSSGMVADLPNSQAVKAWIDTLPTSLTLNAHMVTLPNSLTLNAHMVTLPLSSHVAALPNSQTLNAHIVTLPVSGYLPSSEALNAHMVTLPTSLTLNAHMVTLPLSSHVAALPNSQTLNAHIVTLPTSGIVNDHIVTLPNSQTVMNAISSGDTRVSSLAVQVGSLFTHIGSLATEIFATEVESGYSLLRKQRIDMAVLTGITSGGGSATLHFRDVGDSKSRLIVTVDSDGNRTAVNTLDGS